MLTGKSVELQGSSVERPDYRACTVLILVRRTDEVLNKGNEESV